MIYSIGHSNHTWEKFSGLLHSQGIEAIADVRSAPFSKQFPHFSKNDLKTNLQSINVSYVFLGKELGGRPQNKTQFEGNVADYEKMAQELSFKAGIERLLVGNKRFRIAMMCSEHDPLDCHRCLMVARVLREKGIDTKHILQTGEIITQSEIEEKLLHEDGRHSDDLFLDREEQLSLAYRNRAKRIAYSLDDDSPEMQEAS